MEGVEIVHYDKPQRPFFLDKEEHDEWFKRTATPRVLKTIEFFHRNAGKTVIVVENQPDNEYLIPEKIEEVPFLDTVDLNKQIDLREDFPLDDNGRRYPTEMQHQVKVVYRLGKDDK